MDPTRSLLSAAECGDATRVAQCLDQGADVNARDAYRSTVLILASLNGHVAVVTRLLSAGAVLDVVNKEGETALIFAARRGHDQVVSKLLAAGANIEHVNKTGATALTLAAWHGRTSVVKVLVAHGANVDHANRHRDTALTWAATHGHSSIVGALLRAGVNCDHVNDDGETALHLAVSKGHVEVVRRLLNGGANPDLANHSGLKPAAVAAHRKFALIEQLFSEDLRSAMPFLRAVKRGEMMTVRTKFHQYSSRRGPHNETALHIAAKAGQLDILRLLLSGGMKIDEQDAEGRTPLHWACEQGNIFAVQQLITAGAQLGIPDRKGLSPMAIAAQNGQLTTIRELNMHGASLKTSSLDGRSVLHHAMGHRNGTTVAEYLLNQSVDVDVADVKGWTALHLAVSLGRAEIVNLLLNSAANIDAQDRNGATALYLAAEKEDEVMVHLLLQRGAKVDLSTKSGKTPRTVAKTEGIRVVLEVFYKCQQFRDRCLAMLANPESQPTPDEIIQVVPFITSVHDLRLILPLVSVSDDDAASRTRIITAVFSHIISEKLVFHHDDCVFFKLVLDKWLEGRLITKSEAYSWDRKAETVNTESATWVAELKQQVRHNSWRLDGHDQCLRSVVNGIKQVHAMAMQNQKAVKAVRTRVNRLQREVEHGKKIMRQIIAQGQHISSQVQHLEQRLEQSERNITTVASRLQEFRAAYVSRIEDEEDRKKIKFVCGLLASVAGFIFAPLLKTAFDAIVDFGNPVEVLQLAYGKQDVVGFLAEITTKGLDPLVERQLEKIALPEDDFKSLIREEIAMKHPELLDECTKRGFSVEFHTSKTTRIREIDPVLEHETVQVHEIIAELQSAMEQVARAPLRPRTPPGPGRSLVPERSPHSSNQSNTWRPAPAPTRIRAEPQDTKKATVPAATMLTRPFRSLTSNSSSAASNQEDAQVINHPTNPSFPPEVSGNHDEDAPQTLLEEINSTKALSRFEFLDDPNQFPYHYAVGESKGDRSEFEELLSLFDESDASAGMAIRVPTASGVAHEVRWSAVELACHLGYVEIVMYMLRNVLRHMPITEKTRFKNAAKEKAARLQELSIQ